VKVLDFAELKLETGAHKKPTDGMCVMEAVAFVAGEQFSDHPACASPILGTFLRSWNDTLDDETRQRLKPYIPRLIGTNTGIADEEIRAWMITDWLVREQTPVWLELAGLKDEAGQLRNLPALTSAEIAVACQSVIDNARSKAAAARAAAWDAAWAAARAAAWDAAMDAARAAARDAAWDAAWDAARDAARDAAWAAAWDAAMAAAWDAGYEGARSALRPTERLLQDSAFELLERLIAVSHRSAEPAGATQ
jgi:hypothetical protein